MKSQYKDNDSIYTLQNRLYHNWLSEEHIYLAVGHVFLALRTCVCDWNFSTSIVNGIKFLDEPFLLLEQCSDKQSLYKET